MKKTTLIGVISAIAAITFGGSGLLLVDNYSKETQAAVGNYSTSASTYYNGITATSGTELLGQLHDLITTTHQTFTTYDDCKNPTYVYATDGNPSDSNYDYEFYSQANIGSAWGAGAQGTWNREHVWCQSLTIYNSVQLWGETGGGSDLHHLRPVESGLNSARNNSPYGLVSLHNSTTELYYEDSSNVNVALGGWKTGDVFEPLDAVKGDVARIIMYVYTHYNTYANVGGTTNGSGSSSYYGTLPVTNIVNTTSGTEEAAWDLLLSWNTSDPVDARENRRNEACATYQGNRNPFIDNSTYADAIWGDGTTGVQLNVTPATLSLSPSETSTLTATMSDSSTPTITWLSDATGVATVDSSGLVTAVADGSATITASATVGSETYTGTCAVTVSTLVSGDYIKVTSIGDVTSGDYVIAANASGTYYALPKAFSASRITGSAITVSSDSITSADATNFIVTLSVSGTSVNVFDGTNYLKDSSSTSFAVSTTLPSPASWTLSTGTNGTFRLTGSTQTTRGIIFRAETYNTFGCYATSNATSGSAIYYDIELFKKHVEVSNVVTSLSVTPTSKSYLTTDTLQSADFAVSITKNGAAGSSADYTAKIGTGTGESFSGTTISWGSTKPTTSHTTIQFKAKYPTAEDGLIYLTADVSLTVTAPTLSSIAISQSMTKTSYYTTDSWDPTGLVVTATFSDSSTQNVTSSASWSYSPTSPNSTSITSVTVTATYSGKTDSLAQSVTVTDNTFSGTEIVISEAYGGGGNSGATYKQDFVELYNNTTSPINLSGYRVFYASATGTFSSSTALSGTILAKSYFLVQEAAGTGGTTNIPTADVVGSIAMSGTAFKVALTNSSTAPTAATDANVVDFVGAGSTASLYEGTTKAPAPSNTNSINRTITDGIGIDTNENGTDFTTAAPTPMNGAFSIANRIMAYTGGEITTPECSTKYSTIKSQMLSLTSGSLSYFQSGTETAIANARARYQAWANANGDANPYSASQGLHLTSLGYKSNLLLVASVGVLLLSATIGYCFLKRKKQTN